MRRYTTQTKVISSVAIVCTLLVACTTLREIWRPKPNRGIGMNHPRHAEQGIECTDCHDFAPGQRATFAGHDTCSICHDIPEDGVADASCTFCHTRDDYSVWPKQVVLTEENKFDHTIHISADVSCGQCHSDPDAGTFTPGNLMPLCTDCHEQRGTAFASIAKSGVSEQDFSANDCAVCHRDIRLDIVPRHRQGARLAHDSTQVWKIVHGAESVVDPAFCGRCHDEQEHCADCHRVTKPASHTPAWQRKMHGLQATWDRQSCSVCHEEDSCLKCHENTQPTSHRGGFQSPQSAHCVQCHFPPANNCAICHESIEHSSAPLSPHTTGGGPDNCALCHPGGIPGAIPHFLNMTIGCTFCHQ